MVTSDSEQVSSPQEDIQHHPVQVERFVADPPEREVGSGGEASHKQISDIGNSVNEMSSTPLEEIHLQPRDEEHMAPPVGHGERLKKLRKRMAVEKQKVITYI